MGERVAMHLCGSHLPLVIIAMACTLATTGAGRAADYYFSNCPTGGSGSINDPFCLDPDSDGEQESWAFLADGKGLELAPGDTIRLCAGTCDGTGTATYNVEYQSENPFPAFFNPRVSGTGSNPITITVYCNGSNCETVIMSGDLDSDNIWDGPGCKQSGCDPNGREPLEWMRNQDPARSHYHILGNPNARSGHAAHRTGTADSSKNLVFEKSGGIAFRFFQDGADEWIFDGIEVRYVECGQDSVGRCMWPNAANPTGPSVLDSRCPGSNTSTGFTFYLQDQPPGANFTIRNSLIHHACNAVFRFIANPGSGTILIESNEVYNFGRGPNNHTGEHQYYLDNYLHDWAGAAISIEDNMGDIRIEDNLLECRYDYPTRTDGSCIHGISINNGDKVGPNDTPNGCCDSGCTNGRCTLTKDISVKRNVIRGKSHSGEPGKGDGLLTLCIHIATHNSDGDLGQTVVENNIMSHCHSTFSGSMWGRGGLHVWVLDPITVQNNTIYDSMDPIWVKGHDITLRNNLAVNGIEAKTGKDNPECTIETSANGSAIENNNFFDANSGGVVLRDGSGGSLTCSQLAAPNRCAPPKFRICDDGRWCESITSNRMAWDLHLGADTSDIDAVPAGSSFGPMTDIDGESRPQGAASDIGADESQGVVDTTPPAPPRNLRSGP